MTCCGSPRRRGSASGRCCGRCSLSSERARSEASGAGLERVRARIAAACARAGRDPGGVTLVAVTKGRSAEQIRRVLLDNGHRVLGENRLQEWRQKEGELQGVEWHLVGHLQRNKVRYCRPFALLHSLDSERLGEALEEHGARSGHLFRVLAQINVAGEVGKFGVPVERAEALLDRLRRYAHLRVEGLMTIAPFADDPERARGVFRELRALRDRLELRELSMGMSGDLEVAVEEGATLLRVGSALFEPGVPGAAPVAGG